LVESKSERDAGIFQDENISRYKLDVKAKKLGVYSFISVVGKGHEPVSLEVSVHLQTILFLNESAAYSVID